MTPGEPTNASGGGRTAPILGVSEPFRSGEHARVERTIARLASLGITEFRTAIFWRDFLGPGGVEWYDWLLPTLARKLRLLPTVLGTPDHLGLAPRASSPPRDPKAYPDFIDVLISRYGDHFTHIELWSEPDRLSRWDRRLDPDLAIYTDMIAKAAHWVRRCGRVPVLGGTHRPDPAWLTALAKRDALSHIGVVGVQAFPASDGAAWLGWDQEIARLRDALNAHGCAAEIWITAAGHPTDRHDEHRQAEALLQLLAAPAPRVYWHRAEDEPDRDDASAEWDVHHRERHAGLCRADGAPKLLCRVWEQGGPEALRSMLGLRPSAPAPRPRSGGKPEPAALITGGAGFIGTNLAERIASTGRRVIVYDNLSRAGVERNATYLAERCGGLADIRIEDIRDRRALRAAVAEAAEVYHFAAQVAVTTSLDDPDHDRAVNIGGTMAVLEEVRRAGRPIPVLFTSTNKVYGNLLDVDLRRRGARYEPADDRLRSHGVGERRPLGFCSPYGCSKGAADQYVLDYAASFRVPSVVFRMSCIFGPHQCGNEDQGWVAHFLLRALESAPINIYGDGRQVRDLLYVSDLVNAFLLARSAAHRLAGRVFNIGGGPENAVSLLELLGMIEGLTGERPRAEFAPWRTADQRWYVSDTRAFADATGWRPQVSAREGVRRLHRWFGERTVRSATPPSRIGAVAG